MCSSTILLLVMAYVKRRNRMTYVIVGTIILVLQVCAVSSSYLFPWCIELSGFFSLCMIVGMKMHEHSELRLGYFYSFIVLVAYILLVNYNGQVNLSVNRFGDKGLLSIPLCFVIGVLYFYILQVITKRFEGSKVMGLLAYVGRNSLRIMCIHLPVMLIASGILHKCLPLDGAGAQLCLFLAQLLAVFTSVALLNAFLKCFRERMTLLRYL